MHELISAYHIQTFCCFKKPISLQTLHPKSQNLHHYSASQAVEVFIVNWYLARCLLYIKTYVDEEKCKQCQETFSYIVIPGQGMGVAVVPGQYAPPGQSCCSDEPTGQ